MHSDRVALQVGQIYVSARSKTGRKWKIVDTHKNTGRGYYLLPQGPDVSYSGGGGVRGIYIAGQRLLDPKLWTNITTSEDTPMLRDLVRTYQTKHGEEAAPLNFALDLMRGDPATFKAGYTKENAVLATKDAFDLSIFEETALGAAIDNHLAQEAI